MRLSGESGALFCLHLRSDLFCSVQIPFFEHIDKEKEQGNECLKYETLSLDTKRIKATVDGQEVPLTKKEFEILKLLLENKGNVFSREEILSRIWKDEVYVLDRTIDVNITRLRKKIGIYGKRIVTRLGYGYCFEAE